MDRSHCFAPRYRANSPRSDTLRLTESVVYIVCSVGIPALDHLLRPFVQKPTRDGIR